MFSRPVRSGWNPAPSSSRPASLPRTATSPEVGWSTPQMHLSRVDLPEPFRPEDADRLTLLDRQGHVRQRPESSVDLRRPPWISRSFTVVYFSWARRNRLETPRTSTAMSAHQSSSAKLPSSRPKTANATRKRTTPRTSTSEIEPAVPEHAHVGQDVVHDRSAVDRWHRRRPGVDARAGTSGSIGAIGFKKIDPERGAELVDRSAAGTGRRWGRPRTRPSRSTSMRCWVSRR